MSDIYKDLRKEWTPEDWGFLRERAAQYSYLKAFAEECGLKGEAAKVESIDGLMPESFEAITEDDLKELPRLEMLVSSLPADLRAYAILVFECMGLPRKEQRKIVMDTLTSVREEIAYLQRRDSAEITVPLSIAGMIRDNRKNIYKAADEFAGKIDAIRAKIVQVFPEYEGLSSEELFRRLVSIDEG